jgi:15,16-dihydrobiliverdin:ferredoxin oxidoreductase
MNKLLALFSVWFVSFSSHFHRRGNGIIGYSHALSMWSRSGISILNISPQRRRNFLSMSAGEESIFLRPLSSSLTHKHAFQKLTSFPSWNQPINHLKNHQKQYNYLLRATLDKIGMPWVESIISQQDLTFMPFWNHQISFMEDNLIDLQVSPTTNKASTRDFSLMKGKDVRVANLCFSSSHFRKIRLTYYDAGRQGQVFNSLWYPSLDYDLPVLAIGLLQFHDGKNHLTVIDAQPIHERDFRPSASTHGEHVLANIREQYPILQGKMSSRFYDESQFFSQHMLLARFTDPNVVKEDLWPAFQQCLLAYVTMVHNTAPNPEQKKYVRDRQKAYDVYSANRDPAHAMFKSKFGKSWANEFVYEFLFELSREEFTL